MKKAFSKVLALLIAVIMLLSIVPASVLAFDTMKIVISNTTALAGSTTSVDIKIENNPGLSSLKLIVSFDNVLTLTGITYNTEMGGQTINPETTASPITLNWVSPFAEFTGDAVFATLTFLVNPDIEGDYTAQITATYDPDDIYNAEEENINTTVVNGAVNVVSVVAGDINGDLKVNNKDITRFFQYLANWNVSVNTPALDTNGDGKVNNKDLTRLFQYLANWNVDLYPKNEITASGHTLTETPAVAATCTTDGNIRYWYCTDCGKYFSNASATKEITLADTVISATGHTFATEWSSDGTYHWHAAICEHSTYVENRAEHVYNANNICIICGAEKGVDPTNPYKIKYRLTEYNVNKGDAYIGTQSISKTVTTSISQSTASTIAKTISKSTVDSATWTLAENWNQSTNVNKEWAEEHNTTQEEAKQNATTTSNTLSISSSEGGNGTTTTTDGTTTLKYDSKTTDKETGSNFDVELTAKITETAKAGVGLAEASASVEVGGSIGYGNYDKNKTSDHTGTDTTDIDSTVTANTSTWNSSTTSSSTKQISESVSVSKAISDKISRKTGYGESYSNGGSNSEAQQFAVTDSESNNTSTTLTYSSAETVTTTQTYKADGKSEGCYRLVIAGTVHVFGIVG